MTGGLAGGTRRTDSGPLLSDYADFLRRHGVVFVAALAAGLLIGVGLVLAEPETYTARVSVLTPAVPMHGVPDTSGDPPEEVTIDTEAALLRSGDVLTRLADLHHDAGDPRTLHERISLSVPRHTRVLVIEFRAPTPQGAKIGAELLADTFLDYRQRVLAGRREADLESLRSRIAALQGQLDSLSAAGDDAEAVNEGTISARRQTLVGQIENLEGQLASVEEPAAGPGQVVRAAELPQRPDETNDGVTVASGVGLGLLAAIALGLVRDRLPQRARNEGAVTKRTGLPVLAGISQADMPGPLPTKRTRTAYRRLHNALAADRVGSIVLTANTIKLAETVAVGLAVASGHAGKPTTLLLTGSDGAARPRVGPGLPLNVEVATVLPHQLQDERLMARIIGLSASSDAQVLIVGPPLSRADVLPLGARADAVVLVAERGRTRDRDLTAARRSLELAGAKVLGVVLVRAARNGALAEK